MKDLMDFGKGNAFFFVVISEVLSGIAWFKQVCRIIHPEPIESSN
jgi:hypothetical protein